MFLKKIFYAIKRKRIQKYSLNRYQINIYLGDDKCIDYQYNDFTFLEEEDFIQDNINKDFIKIDNWYINYSQIQSIKITKVEKTDIYCLPKHIEYIKYLDVHEIQKINERYNDFLISYKSLFKK